jgi:hemerythrin-like domain-containing protein
MPVIIGQKPDHDFSRPLGMLSDCHRRIERFLSVLTRLSGDAEGSALTPEQRLSLTGALRYFRESGPRHTADEEASLFPRLRLIEDDEVRRELAEIDRLEADHDRADALHAEADSLGARWLLEGVLTPGDALRFKQVSEELAGIYSEHIRAEDTRVFPLAERVLSVTDRQAMGREMAARRDVKIGTAI